MARNCRHWQAEKANHDCCDVGMGEDASRVRKGHASTNNATLNNIVLTLETHCGFRYLPKVNQHFMMRHQG